jgi:hypothetical protein
MNPSPRPLRLWLTQGDASVTKLTRPFAVSLPAISKQLRMLDQAGTNV